VGIYGIISILIFVAFFVVTLLWVFGLKQGYIKHMGELPLDSGEQDTPKPSTDKNL
jgi:hypothetical protein